MSQITTHVLDTSLGKPAEGLAIALQQLENGKWENIASGRTNADGRIANLLLPNESLVPGVYRMEFQTGEYYQALETRTFYPVVHIQFETFDREHYHVPLLLNPYGYSTYRGS